MIAFFIGEIRESLNYLNFRNIELNNIKAHLIDITDMKDLGIGILSGCTVWVYPFFMRGGIRVKFSDY